MPAFFAAFWMITAYSGSSRYFSVVSVTLKPLGWPAAASSSFALAMSSSRCATVVSVEGKTGASGLSLPTLARPLKRPFTIFCRLRQSAIAWRTRMSSKGAMSVRMCTCSQAQLFSVLIVQQSLAAHRGDLRDDVDLAALQRHRHRLLAVEERPFRAVRQRLLAPVVVVAHERRADLGGE